MNIPKHYTVPLAAFVASFAIRLLFVPLSLLRIQPYSKGDPVTFIKAATLIASRIGTYSNPFNLPEYTHTNEIWGGILAPFWLLPGPSELYAHIVVALLGAIAVYNIACLAQWFHSPQAAIYAALPFIFYPTIVLSHATLHRESAILFGLTCTTRYILAPPETLPKPLNLSIVFVTLTFATLLRSVNLPLYFGAIAVGLLIWAGQRSPQTTAFATVVTAPISGWFLFQKVSSAIDDLLRIRAARAYGRTVYLEFMNIGGVLEVLAFSWIAAVYFLYSPFPWMIGSILDIPVAAEGVISMIYTIATILSIPYLSKRHLPGVGALIIAFIVGVSLYGIGTVNVGTASRHRPMFLWVVLLFGGIGLAQHLEIRHGKILFPKLLN